MNWSSLSARLLAHGSLSSSAEGEIDLDGGSPSDEGKVICCECNGDLFFLSCPCSMSSLEGGALGARTEEVPSVWLDGAKDNMGRPVRVTTVLYIMDLTDDGDVPGAEVARDDWYLPYGWEFCSNSKKSSELEESDRAARADDDGEPPNDVKYFSLSLTAISTSCTFPSTCSFM